MEGIDQPDRRILFSADRIAARIETLGREITAHYASTDGVVAVAILKGTFVFLGDLVRRIDRPLQVDFLVAGSYGSRKTSSGTVRVAYEPTIPLADRHILLIEDIVDSGTTLNYVVPMIERTRPRSVEICTLLRKPVVGDLVREPRWVGFEAPDEFLIGYGLDHDEDYRNLPYIASI